MKRPSSSDVPDPIHQRIIPALVAGAVLWAACGGGSSTPGPAPSATDHGAALEDSALTIEEVLAAHTDEWMAIEGVEGTGIGLCDDAPCIKIFVSRPPAEFDGVLPETAGGHLIRLEPTGNFAVQ